MEKSFLDQEPPPGYVAGIGRGAVGFNTSADTRASKIESSFQVDSIEDDDDLDSKFTDANEVGILGKQTKADEDDLEADRIYEQIENRMKSRSTEVIHNVEDNSIRERFSDLKRGLGTITNEEWESLPEAGDMTRRNKRQRLLEQQNQRTYAAPDSLIANGKVTDFESISRSRNELLNKQLDTLVPRNEESNSIEFDEVDTAQVANIDRSRLILDSLRKAEPYKASSWIASARLELQAKNLTKAKNLINEGSKLVPRNEDIWLENLKIHQFKLEDSKLSKAIISTGLRFNPKSEVLWLKAYELEADISLKKNLLMQALESLPLSTQLWEKLIELQDDSANAKKLLEKAIELCPTHWDFMLALIGLSDYTESKKLLNKSRKLLPDNFDVWVAAAKLEERENDKITDDKLFKILEKGLLAVTLTLDRQVLFDYADTCQKDGYTKTCKALIRHGASKIDPGTSLSILLHEASKYSKAISSYIYDYLIVKFPNDVEGWVQVFESLKEAKDLLRLYEFYQKAIDANPNTVLFSLMYAKDKWILDNDIPEARKILAKSLQANMENEDLWIARIKLEVKTRHYPQALEISEQSIIHCATSSRIWYKHIHLLGCVHFSDPKLCATSEISSIIDKALDILPECEKINLQKVQHFLRGCDDFKRAREVAAISTRTCPKSSALWILLAEIDEKNLNTIIRARSVLDNAVIKNPDSDKLWEAKIKLERRHEDLKAARLLITKALQLFPNSARIWTQHLELIPKSQRQKALLEALKKTNNSSYILLNIGVLFWMDGKISKAKPWFDRSLNSDKSNGDCWAWSYSYAKSHSTPEELTKFLQDYNHRYEQINKGDTWNSINKSIENFEKEPLQILELVAQDLLKV